MKPTFHTIPDYTAECECGWRCQTRNAFGLAAQHHARCGQRTRLEANTVFVWEDKKVRQMSKP